MGDSPNKWNNQDLVQRGKITWQMVQRRDTNLTAIIFGRGVGLIDAQSIQVWPHPMNKSSLLVAHTNCALLERRPGTAASLTLHGEEHGLADVCPNPVAGLAQIIADVFF